MTAELIIMNKNGLALAADSAVTISSGGKPSKVYNTSNKLFMLSKVHPVGVMIYGSAEIMGLPWEVVIKRYRERLGDRSFPSINAYVTHFLEHLKSEAFTTECYIAYVKQRAAEFFNAIANNVDEQVEKIIQEKGQIEESEIANIHTDAISKASKYIRELQKKQKIKRADIADSMSTHRDVVRQIINTLLEKRPVTGPNKRKLVDACLIAAIVFPGINQSGLVIAGFGDDDVFPSAIAFDIHKILDGKLQFFSTYKATVTLNNTVHIRAFAQSNETQNFMNGLSGRINEYINNDMEKIFSGAFSNKVTNLLIKDGIVPKEKYNDCKTRLGHAGLGVYTYIKNRMEDISRREFSGPVVSAVAFFSPTEMAAMAETLVSIESFRQQVTLRSETVGGPIDVAVITRGDGYIWIKRKHYFKPELNHQFFSNYNRNMEAVDDNQDDE